MVDLGRAIMGVLASGPAVVPVACKQGLRCGAGHYAALGAGGWLKAAMRSPAASWGSASSSPEFGVSFAVGGAAAVRQHLHCAVALVIMLASQEGTCRGGLAPGTWARRGCEEPTALRASLRCVTSLRGRAIRAAVGSPRSVILQAKCPRPWCKTMLADAPQAKGQADKVGDRAGVSDIGSSWCREDDGCPCAGCPVPALGAH